MQDTKSALLDGAKTAVAQCGLAEFSARKLSAVSGVNTGLIYHYFDNLQDLLLSTYQRENGHIFESMLAALDEARELPGDFKTRARRWFRQTWRMFLSDKERLTFCVLYYHSSYFKQAEAFHSDQLNELLDRMQRYFKTKDDCIQTMYSLMTLFYDSAKRVVDGISEDTAENEGSVFDFFYSMLMSKFTLPKNAGITL